MNLFSTNSSWDFHTFLKEVEKSSKTNIPPSLNQWPQIISLTTDIWNRLLKIKKYTGIENRERSASFFWADGDVVTSEYIRGDENSVKVSHSAQLKYNPTTNNNYFEKQIIVDGKIVKKYTIELNKIPQEPKIIPVFNVHTHPKNNSEDKAFYNFFSNTDINALMSSKSICSGLLIDQFWLIGKSERTNLNGDNSRLLERVNSRFTLLGEDVKGKYLQEFSNSTGIVIYRAKEKGRLVRV